MSLLAIDAGNTRIKWGLHDAGRWLATGSVATADAGSLARSLPAGAKVVRAIACNVAGDAVGAALVAATRERGAALRFVHGTTRVAGMVNRYRDPAQLGPDRWAAAVAARALSNAPTIVATAGTALTVDAVSSAGEFLGGLIVAGPALMRRTLAANTARLRETEGRYDDFPAATADAITSGAIQACVGAIERMHELLEAREGARPALLLSGGAASELAPHVPIAHTVREHLVLEGLVRLDAEA
jgi:type III pantothenate kinase